MGKIFTGKLFAIVAAAAATLTLTAVPAQADPVFVYQLAGSPRCIADNGTDIVFKFCNEQARDQQWLVPISGGYDQPRNIATNKCLAARTTGEVERQSCTSATNQRWRRLTPSGNTFQFQNIGTRKCLTAQLTVATCTSSSQRWVGRR